MNKLMITLFVLICSCQLGVAQFYKSVLPSPEFTSALEKIVLDFRFNYKNIKDSSILKEGGTETFESAIKLPGAQQCRITFYNSKLDTSASWQAVVYRGANFSEAVRAYQNTFRLVKKSHLNWIDRSLMRFTGDLENPKEEVDFATSTLRLDLDDDRYKKFAAEIELLNSGYDTWEVHLNLQTKKNDDEKF